ncbi:MAG: glycosyltransferase [Marinibacterium sp.]
MWRHVLRSVGWGWLCAAGLLEPGAALGYHLIGAPGIRARMQGECPVSDGVKKIHGNRRKFSDRYRSPSKNTTTAGGEGPPERWRATNAVRQGLVDRLEIVGEDLPVLRGFDWSSHFADCGKTPKRVVQFWDRDPPDQITQLLRQTESVCADSGYDHQIFDLDGARARIGEIAGSVWLDYFDRASHPAMQSDIFRLLEVRAGGGFYMDADMALAKRFPFSPPPVPLFVQWARGRRSNVANWFFGGPPEHAIFDRILAEMQRMIETMPVTDTGQFEKVDLVAHTGPGPISRALESYLRKHADRRDVAVMPVHWSHRFVRPGHRFLKATLDYKRDGTHWQHYD